MEEFLGGSPCLLDCLCFSYKNEAKRGRILRRQSLDNPEDRDCRLRILPRFLATKMRPSVEEFLGGSPCLLDCLCFSYKNEAKRGRILRRQSLSSGLSMLYLQK